MSNLTHLLEFIKTNLLFLRSSFSFFIFFLFFLMIFKSYSYSFTKEANWRSRNPGCPLVSRNTNSICCGLHFKKLKLLTFSQLWKHLKTQFYQFHLETVSQQFLFITERKIQWPFCLTIWDNVNLCSISCKCNWMITSLKSKLHNCN